MDVWKEFAVYLFAGCVLTAVVYAIVASAVRYYMRPPTPPLAMAPAPVEDDLPPARCDNCVHFDFKEGQAIMRKNPLAQAAYQVITPNMAMTKRDKDGKELPLEKSLRAKDDTFDTLGACMLNEHLRLGCDKCPSWKRARDTKLTVVA